MFAILMAKSRFLSGLRGRSLGTRSRFISLIGLANDVVIHSISTMLTIIFSIPPMQYLKDLYVEYALSCKFISRNDASRNL